MSSSDSDYSTNRFLGCGFEANREAKMSSSDDDLSSENESTSNKKAKIDHVEQRELGNPNISTVQTRPFYSMQSQIMMDKMNYDKEKGLGKHGQGRKDIVEVSAQKGRRGLGLKLDGLEIAASSWNESLETLHIPEKVYWLDNRDDDDITYLSRDLLEAWIKHGEAKETLRDETKFCDANVLEKVLQCKSAFDNLGANEMRRARTRSNPFEMIKSNIFMNRAAVKMANMDAMFDYMFTNPIDVSGKSMVSDLLYFADVCAGPGGFSEYFLWRKKWLGKGFGFTLKNENDFKLHDFIAGSPETFDPYYGPKEDGNIFDPENIQGFTDYVMKQTELGVHVMMADGGFSVEGRENEQEILSKQLYLCQILVALNIVRTGGHFVVKLFDIFTPFSVGLIYLVYKCFKKICICKPNTSRPANSERYLVCKWKKAGIDAIQRHLFEVNRFLLNKNRDTDILELVPYEVLRENHTFFQYICDSNNELGKCQIIGLLKIAAFCANQNLNEPKQAEVKSKCLSLWKLDDIMRKATRNVQQSYESLKELLKDWYEERIFLLSAGKSLQELKPKNVFESIHGWYFVPIENRAHENDIKYVRTFFLKASKDVMQLNIKPNTWTPIKDVNLELAPNTLVYGEITKEYKDESRSQTTISAFHIIDGIVLGGVDIRKYPLLERIRMCDMFAKALNKPCRTVANSDTTYTTIPVRCKRLFPLLGLNDFFERLELRTLKNGLVRFGYNLRNTNEPDRYYVPKGLLFLNEIRDDYMKMFSKSRNKFYFFHKPQKMSHFPEQMKCIEQTNASFKNTYVNRVIWEWNDPRQLSDESNANREPNMVYLSDIRNFLKQVS